MAIRKYASTGEVTEVEDQPITKIGQLAGQDELPLDWDEGDEADLMAETDGPV